MSNIQFRTPPISSWLEAQSALSKLRPSLNQAESCEVRVGYKTWLGYRAGANHFYVRHHNTDIVTYHPSGQVDINNGGWFSPTTKTRINYFSPIYIWQKDWEWYYTDSQGRTMNFFGDAVVFTNSKDNSND